MKTKHGWVALAILLCSLAASESRAQITFSEDFTGGTTNNSWYFFSGACLTAGTSSATTSPGTIPGCTSVLLSYYENAANADPYLVGGNNGKLQGGRHLAFPTKQVPSGNLLLSILDQFDIHRDSFGDSTGPLPGLV